MGDKVLIVFAYDPNDEEPDWPVACSIMFIGTTTLYGRFWGCRAEYNALHFEACYYQGIEYCIENGISRFEPGAQGEHKITRGFVPTLTRSAHYIDHPQFRDAIGNFLKQEVPHIQQRCNGLNDLLPFKADSIKI
jgi:predicted N-acyltransferase